jgi:hypothetical protein
MEEEVRLSSRDQSKIIGLLAACDAVRDSLFLSPEERHNSIVSFKFGCGDIYISTGEYETNESFTSLTLEVRDSKGKAFMIPWWLVPDTIMAVFGDGTSVEFDTLGFGTD